jgi:hypothetical protein
METPTALIRSILGNIFLGIRHHVLPDCWHLPGIGQVPADPDRPLRVKPVGSQLLTGCQTWPRACDKFGVC